MSSMTKKDVLALAMRVGAMDSADLQARAASMDGTALIAEESKIISFDAARRNANMLTRAAGFACAYDGQVYQLIQPYDSDIYTNGPDSLRAQWSLCHTKDCSAAKPFVPPLGTSGMYMEDECCTEGGKTWRSIIDNNVWAPSAYPQGWEEVTA